MRPLLRVDGDDIGVPHQQERPLLAVALDPHDEIRPLRIPGEHLIRNALLVEDLLQVLDRAHLVPRRTAGVELEQRLEVREGLGLEGGLIGGRLLCL